jgi:hypothetical protein
VLTTESEAGVRLPIPTAAIPALFQGLYRG